MCISGLLFSASADLFIMCQDSVPSLVVKRGQVGAKCPDCQLSAAVGLFMLTESSLSHKHTHTRISTVFFEPFTSRSGKYICKEGTK